MKLFNLLSFFLLNVSSYSFSQKSDNVSVTKFKELCDSGNGIILDVRTPEEFSKGHIESATAINIYDKSFESKIKLMQKDKQIYVYCLSGARSESASKILLNNGFKEVFNLQGGILSWKNAGYKLEVSNVAIAKPSNSISIVDFNKIINSNNIVLCDFYASWCAPCKQMLPVIERIEIDFKTTILVQKIDIENSSDLAKVNNVNSIPTFLIFKDGKKVWEKKGVTTYTELVEEIKKYQ